MTNEEAAIIIGNLKPYLKNAEKLTGKKLHEDIYTAIDMALKALDEMPYGFTFDGEFLTKEEK